MGLLERLTSLWRRDSPPDTLQTKDADRPDATPLTHNTEQIRETDFIYRQLQVETNRRAVLRDVQNMLEADPLIDETNSRISRKSVRGGIFITVNGSGKHQQKMAVRTGQKAGRGAQMANRAQQVVDEFMSRCKVDSLAPLWISRLLADGDLFINIVVEDGGGQPRISAIRWVPPAIIKRNEDQFGQFIDVNRAFSEIDPLNGLYFQTVIPGVAVRHFPLWAINHVRWKYRGGLYGNSQYLTIRKLSRQNASSDDDMVVRRKVRAPLRRAHIIGSKDAPGDPKTVEKYKSEHKDAIVKGKYTPVTDYYMNGLGDVKNLEGDGNLDKIADVKYLYDKENTGTIIPKGLVGHAEDINRDVLDDQKEEYYDTIEDIRHLLEYGDGGPFSGLRAIIDFELLLHGIDVEALGLSYDIAFSPLRDKDPAALIDRTIKAKDGGLIDRRTAVVSTAHIFNVEDPNLLLEAIEQEEKEALKKAQQAMQKQPGEPGGQKGGDDDEVITDSEEDDEEEPEYLKRLAPIEKKAERLWKKRFLRLNKLRQSIGLPIQSGMNDAEEEEDAYYLNQEDIDAYMDAVVDVHSEDRDAFATDLGYVYTHSGEVGGLLAEATTGISFELHREDILNDLLKESAKRVKGIDNETEKQLREALGQGYMTGSKRELVKLVEEALGEVFANAYANRTATIARTESMWAFNGSTLRMYAEAGFNTGDAPTLPAHPRCRCAYGLDGDDVIILVTKDERTCPVCKKFIGNKNKGKRR